MTVLIAGAGIAGLSLALTCHELGLPVKVFEQVDNITPLGVGINLQPHAVREIFEMGLADEIEQIGLRTREVAYFSKAGHRIWSEERGEWAGYNWPQYSIHRGYLQMMLFDAVVARLGPDCIETGAQVDGFSQTDSGVSATIRTKTGTKQVTGAVLVGADGIHSGIRAHFHPDEGAPVWGGAVLWRGTTTAKPFLSGATMAMAGHENQKFVTYPISRPDPQTGESLINWIAELKFKPDASWNREDYNRAGKLADFLPRFESWAFDWLDIPQMIRDANIILEFPMIDRNPLDRWSHNRVTLLGDAAHAMYPIGSNGATQGIIDARVLGKYFASHGVGAAALAAYDTERRPVCNAIVLANRGNGPDQVMELVEQRCGGDFARIEDVLTREELTKTASAYKKVAGFEVETLNNAPSIVGG